MYRLIFTDPGSEFELRLTRSVGGPRVGRPPGCLETLLGECPSLEDFNEWVDRVRSGHAETMEDMHLRLHRANDPGPVDRHWWAVEGTRRDIYAYVFPKRCWATEVAVYSPSLWPRAGLAADFPTRGLYRHAKGGFYDLVTDEGTWEEGGERVVTYRALSDGRLWHRKKSVFDKRFTKVCQ